MSELTKEELKDVMDRLFRANSYLGECAYTLRNNAEAKELLYHAGMTIKRLQDVLEPTPLNPQPK